MNVETNVILLGDDPDQIIEPIGYDFGLSRRTFVQCLGAGLLITAIAPTAIAQERQRGRTGGGRRGGAPVPVEARLHIAPTGEITVMTGKVECGQGSRAQITQAAAEELRVSPDRIKLLMADTATCPDDGITAGSRTTPSTLPSVRQACARARELLLATASEKLGASADSIEIKDGVATSGAKKLSYADLVALKQPTGTAASTATPAKDWTTLGKSFRRPNARDIITGKHHYPSDITRPGMVYGKILRPASYGATLKSLDTTAAKAIAGVTVVQDNNFVGVAAPSTHVAKQAIAELEKTAQWDRPVHPSSSELYNHLRKHADVPANPFTDKMTSSAKSLKATYAIPYVQHTPMEPRAAVAEWEGEKLTVWTGTQNPFGVRRELAGAFRIDEKNVRVIVPDFGGGFGGKHTGETAVEAARLAKSAGKPVALRWTREEEFTWASFRPAAVIDIEATLDDAGKITSWHFININAGGSGVESPYKHPQNSKAINSSPPLRHGSYRALASTGSNFARESFIDELALLANQDPLAFRLANLEDERLRAVLEKVAKEFDFTTRRKNKSERRGVGIACGTEKGSFVAAAAEIEIDDQNTIHIRHVCQAFDCGPITSPHNLHHQNEGAIVQAIGPLLRESIAFEDGKVTTSSLWKYKVPRIDDLPKIDIHLINRPDVTAAGAGETPLIALAPAVANAVFHATGQRLRELPLQLQSEKKA